MSRSKKIFVAFALIFFLLLMYVAYDIGSRTTFPGSKADLEETAPDSSADSVASDSRSTPQ